MIDRYRDGVVPEVEFPAELAADLGELPSLVCGHLDRVELTLALEAIWSRVRRLNRYVEEQAPWNLAKDLAKAEQLDQVLYGLAEGIRAVSVVLHPYMPATTTRLLEALGHTGDDALSLEHAGAGAVEGGGAIGKLEPLFPKIEAVEAS
jgi:methionyl-tRNA synthetase